MLARSFSIDDQRRFAETSGDPNPLHVDPVHARRLLYGRAVVHGIHQVLWALDEACAQFPAGAALIHIACRFTGPVGVDEPCRLTIEHTGDRLVCRIHAAQGEATVIDARFGPVAAADKVDVHEGLPPMQQPVVVARDAVAAAAGSLPLFLDGASFGRLFPRASARLPRSQAAILLATTRLVGVHCPGLHSIFSELTLDFTGGGQSSSGGPGALGYRVVQYDSRMGLVRLRVDAPRTSGAIRAFFRPAPATQPTATELRSHVEPSEFAGRRALVVGGSRGLGALAAKLLAAGGADVVLTYFVGASDAQDVAAEAAQVGARVRTIRLDVRDADDEVQAALADLAPFTHLYYFATAPIFVARRGHFNAVLFEHFCDIYVKGFVKLVRALLPFGLGVALYPSSTAVTDAPIDMGEYAAAKAAGEAACRFLEKAHPGLTVFAPRLPRLPTDQTRSLLAVRDDDPVAYILAALRRG